MAKVFLGILVLMLVVVFGYYRNQSKPVDAREMINSGVQLAKKEKGLSGDEEELLKVQLAIVDYMAKNQRAPETLMELVPTYFDSVPKDPRTNKPVEYVREGSAYRLGPAQAVAMAAAAASQTSPAASQASSATSMLSDADFVNPNEMKPETFVYDATGKRDPFLPFDFSKASADGPASPLERYSLGQLRLTAVIVDPKHGATAIVEDATGKGFTVRPGMRIDNQGGVVVSIEPEPKPGRMKVLETKMDFTGKESEEVAELKIQAQAETAAQTKGRGRKGR